MNTFITYFFLLALLPVYAQSPTQKKLDSLEQVLLTVNKNDTKKIVSIGEYLIANTESDEKKFYLLGIIISSYATNNDKKKSIEYLFRAKKIAEDIGDVELTTKVYATLASLYASLKLNDKAMLYLKEAWQQTEKLPAGNEKSSIRAFLYNEQGNFTIITNSTNRLTPTTGSLLLSLKKHCHQAAGLIHRFITSRCCTTTANRSCS